MKKDHALIYKGRSLKNWPHRKRLKAIRGIIEQESLKDNKDLKYADIGCGTGYLTAMVADLLQPSEVVGFDHSEHLEVARQRYPGYRFGFLELNDVSDVGQYDFVTCFETIEHVGDPFTAIDNVINATSKNGTLLVTIPIEIGPVGTLKFLAKTVIYGYKMDEIAGENTNLFNEYLWSLLTYRDISRFRDQRFGWGTHFGFDYRRIDEYLVSKKIPFSVENVGTSRFYTIKP